MRILRPREHGTRPTAKPDGVIIFQASTQNWRDRVKALKAAQGPDQGKGDNGLKPDRA
jgi:hypothetical protein